MAPLSKTPLNAGNALYERILSLDRSKEDIPSQIAEAYKILEIEPDKVSLCYNEEDGAVQGKNGFGPLEEWCMRWLLKRFNIQEIQADSLPPNPKAWLLLRLLVARLPINVAARTLNTHKFLEALGKTLQWVDQEVNTTSDSRDAPIQQLRDSTDESSSATLEASQPTDGIRSKKRKREVTTDVPIKLHKSMPVDTATLYVSISGTLQQIQARIAETKEGVQGFASEYMKTTIKCTPDQAAEMLGHSLNAMKTFLTDPRYKDVMDAPNLPRSLISPIVALWDLRSTVSDDIVGNSSIRSFSKQALVPALQVLVALRRRSGNFDENVIQDIERMIAVYTILPLRTWFRRKMKDHDTNETDTPYAELLTSLSSAVASELNDKNSSNGSSLSLSSIPQFFDLSLKCLLLRTSKQRITEAPWLQDFFLQLAQCTFLLLPTSVTATPPEVSIDIMKKMLGLINVSKIQFETSFFETIIRQYAFNSNESSDYPVDWSLVSLCMQNDENLMLPFSKNKEADKKSRSKSRLLTQLLSKLVVAGLKDDKQTSSPAVIAEVYNFTLDNIACPLGETFAHARDLPGFFDVWQHQLVTWRTLSLTLDRTILNQIYSRSIWEDDKLSHMVAANIEPILTVGQISSILQALLDIFQPWFASTDAQSPSIYAGTIILDCLVDGIKGEIAISQTSGLIKSFYEGLSEILDNGRLLPSQCRWRIWRILATMMTRRSNVGLAFRIGTVQAKVVIKAQGTVQQALLSEHTSHEATYRFDEALYAMQFMVIFISTQPEIREVSHSEALQVVIQTMVSLMEKSVNVPCKSKGSAKQDASVNVTWDGSRRGIDNYDVLLLLCSIELMLSSCLLKIPDKSLLYRFLTQLYWLAYMQSLGIKYTAPNEHQLLGVSYSWLWEEIQQDRMTKEHDPLIRPLCNVLVQQFGEELSSDLPPPLIDFHLSFAIESLLRIPNEVFERQERAQVANLAISRLLFEENLVENRTILGLFNLLIRSLDSPNKSMKIVTDSKCLWTLANKLDGAPKAILEKDIVALLHAYKQLTQVVLKYAVTRSNQASEKIFLRSFVENLSIRNPIIVANPTCATSLLVTTSLEVFRKHDNDLSQVLGEELPGLLKLRIDYFQTLSNHFTITAIQRPLWSLGVLLESLSCLSDLLSTISPEADFWAVLQSCISNLEKFTTKELSGNMRDSKSISNIENTLVLARKVEIMKPKSCKSADTILSAVELRGIKNDQAQRILLKELKNLYYQTTPMIQADILSEIVRRDSESSFDISSLLQLRSILNAQNESTEGDEMVRSALAQSLSKLCDQLGQSTSTMSCILRMHCMDIMIRNKPWCVLQWHVDNILSAITIMTSISSPRLPIKSAGGIFTGLCKLFSSLLTAHRAKLGGRYHLILLALQGLLRCLFEPFSQNADPKQTIPQPQWLDPQSHILTEIHASAYARILTTICDPSVSAVTRTKNRSRQELNDETKKARSIAGQHLQYLIMDFCQCQLRGRMSPEMMTVLNPGLYAIFDAMSQEVMRTVNSALDSSGRAIFKVLYNDYRRFGKWKGA